MDFGIVLGYAGWGYVRRAIQYVKCAGLIPLLVADPSCDDYRDVLPEDLILRTRWVNRDHQRLAGQIEECLRQYAGDASPSVRFISNFADRMWLCYVDLRRHFRAAAGVNPDAIIRTANKANLRHIYRGTRWDVAHVLVPSQYADNPLSLRSLRSLLSKTSDVIVKPVFGIAAEAVSRIPSSGEESLFVRAIQKVIQQQRSVYSDTLPGRFLNRRFSSYPANSCALVEDYLDGAEFSVEGFATADSRPSALVIQRKTLQEQEPVFRDLEYLVDGGTALTRVRALVSDLLRRTKFSLAPFHIEMKGSEAWVKPIEFNPRMGGGSIIELVSSVNATDLQGMALTTQLAGLKLNRILLTTVIQPRSGKRIRIVEYRGLAEVERHPDVVFVKKIVQVGAIVTATDREVYLIEFCVTALTAEAARQRAISLRDSIEVFAEEVISA